MTSAPLHVCEFDEVEIDEDDGPLKVGMRVMVPCECGATPLEEWEFLKARDAELSKALTQRSDGESMPLYHWSPVSRRKQIIRHGLRPSMRSTTSSYSPPYVCFADSPSWAWALSGGQRHAPSGEWDLWQTWMHFITPTVLATPDRPSGLHEVRAEHRVYKRDLWHVGSRVKK